jgi:hypothetical protein
VGGISVATGCYHELSFTTIKNGSNGYTDISNVHCYYLRDLMMSFDTCDYYYYSHESNYACSYTYSSLSLRGYYESLK